MKNWEDVIKDKLENYESLLPKGSFEDFTARREKSKKAPFIWIPLVAPAACLALLLLLKHPSSSEAETGIIQHSSDVVASTTVIVEVTTEEVSVKQNPSQTTVKPTLTTEQQTKSSSEITIETSTESPTLISDESEKEKDVYKQGVDPLPLDNEIVAFVNNTPIPPETYKKSSLAPVFAIGGLAAVITPTVSLAHSEKKTQYVLTELTNPLTPIHVNDILTNTKHYFPLKFGLSTNFPVSKRLNISTGLEYSLYTSDFIYSISGIKKQHAHYVGIPVRLDWVFASNDWMNAYIGAGASGDYCISATAAGEQIDRDRLCFSVIGAGGIQVNLTKAVGVYFEPEISWSLPSKNRILKTYRTEHPVMFSLATGLRINLVKQYH